MRKSDVNRTAAESTMFAESCIDGATSSGDIDPVRSYLKERIEIHRNRIALIEAAAGEELRKNVFDQHQGLLRLLYRERFKTYSALQELETLHSLADSVP